MHVQCILSNSMKVGGRSYAVYHELSRRKEKTRVDFVDIFLKGMDGMNGLSSQFLYMVLWMFQDRKVGRVDSDRVNCEEVVL